jgi:hypothetical protein
MVGAMVSVLATLGAAIFAFAAWAGAESARKDRDR